MSWSPDNEVVALYSQSADAGVSTVYILVSQGSELDFLAEIPFSTSEFGEGQDLCIVVFLLPYILVLVVFGFSTAS